MNGILLPLFWTLLQVTIVATIALVVHAAVRQFSRNAAAAVALTGLLTIGALSVAAFLPLPDSLHVRTPLDRLVATRLAAPATVEVNPGTAEVEQPVISKSKAASSPTAPPVESLETTPSSSPKQPADSNAGGAGHFTVNASRNSLPVLLALVATSVLIGGIRFLIGLLAVRGYCERSREILDPALQEDVDILQAELSSPQEVAVRESAELRSAATVGWKRPVLLLPADWTEWTAEERRAILAHELAHIRHRDYPAWLAAQIPLVLHFYHPLVHALAHRFRLDQELAADATAASLVGGEQPYLQILARVAIRQADAPMSWPARTFLPTRGTFLRRIEMLRDSRHRQHGPSSLRARSLAVLTIALAGIFSAGMRPGSSPIADAAPRDSAPQAAIDSSVDVPMTPSQDRHPIVVAQNTSAPEADKKLYSSADEAFAVGAAFYNSRNFAKSLEPFEAALAMAPNDAFRLKVYRALIPAYRQLPEHEKLLTAIEYVVEHSDREAEKSLLARSLVSFVHERGKTDDAIKRYEERLKKNPKDRTSLMLLSEIYTLLRLDPKRAAELTEQLLALKKEVGGELDVRGSAQLAMQYVRSGKLREGAELYEKIAPLDEKLAAWHYKEAAAAWLKAGEKTRAIAAAKKSAESPPEVRSEQLTYFWHRALGDVFLDGGDPKSAIPHYEKAIEKTTIDGYLKSSRERLEEARKKAAE